MPLFASYSVLFFYVYGCITMYALADVCIMLPLAGEY